MEAGLTLQQIVWAVCQICIIVALAVGAVAAVIWWIIKAFDDKEKIENHKSIANGNASSADTWLGRYYDEREAHREDVEYYKRELRRKCDDVDAMLSWDEKRVKRIKQLEKQLKDNGIEPDEWDLAA